MKWLIWIVVVAFMIAGAFVAHQWWSGHPTTSFKTIPVNRGDLLVSISATGTVEPEEVVDVGAQVAGKIESFGDDPKKPGNPIDYGSEVVEGTVLAHIDDALYVADVASSTADLDQTRANVLRAGADLESKTAAQDQAAAGVDLALITYNQLKGVPIYAESDIEVQTAAANLKQAQAALETAKANVAVAQATLAQTRGAVAQAEANLGRAKTNLDYCTIRSPVNGTIIDRRVNIGQTVVASLNAPSLFLIAKDLKRMEVWASVNEADIGNIHPGQPARFTVDAYPGRQFVGEVGKVRLNATMTQNVVTYTVEITTENSDGKLLPYLTANVQFEVDHLKNVLTVPSAALRWIPSPQKTAPEARSSPTRSPDSGPASDRRVAAARGADQVWVVSGDLVRPIRVRAGPGDGSQTQIEGDDVREGMQVVVGEMSPAESAQKMTNPFAPQVFGNRRQQ
jgi:HlyD family secretion protein